VKHLSGVAIDQGRRVEFYGGVCERIIDRSCEDAVRMAPTVAAIFAVGSEHSTASSIAEFLFDAGDHEVAD